MFKVTEELAKELHDRGITVLVIPVDGAVRTKMKLIRDDREWTFSVNLPRIDDVEVWADRIEARFDKLKALDPEKLGRGC